MKITKWKVKTIRASKKLQNVTNEKQRETLEIEIEKILTKERSPTIHLPHCKTNTNNTTTTNTIKTFSRKTHRHAPCPQRIQNKFFKIVFIKKEDEKCCSEKNFNNVVFKEVVTKHMEANIYNTGELKLLLNIAVAKMADLFKDM